MHTQVEVLELDEHRQWVERWPTADGEAASALIQLPVVGDVAAGTPIEAIENQVGTLELPLDFFKARPTYLLRVKGDSMIDAGIQDGDLVAVRKADQAEQSEFVIARVHDEVTLKEFKVEAGRPVLLPHNRRYEPIMVAPDDFVIEGVFVGLIRKNKPH